MGSFGKVDNKIKNKHSKSRIIYNDMEKILEKDPKNIIAHWVKYMYFLGGKHKFSAPVHKGPENLT